MSQVQPATHEAECWLYYGPVDDGGSDAVDYDGLDPYWAIGQILIGYADGFHEFETEIDGEHFEIRLNYSKSGFRPRREDDVDSDRLYEFDLNLSGRGERKCHFNISPRYEDMRDTDGERVDLPWQYVDPDEGMCVHCQPSNVALDEIEGLFARAVMELFDEFDEPFYHGYVDAPFSGRITALERYVRIIRNMNEQLIQTGGVLDRMAMLLSDVEGTTGELKWDNEEVRGHHHVIRHGSKSARELVGLHELGGQLKSYLPEHPERFDPEDPLYHPKVGAKFVAGRNGTGAVPWSARHDVVDELDERLLSVLSWAGIPTEAGGTTYVADDHFQADAAGETVPLHADPLPELEAEQEHLLVTTLREMTDADSEIVETLVTDGGQDAERLADETETSLSTVYRCLDRMDGILTSDNGHVQFVSERLQSDVRAMVESVEETIASAADRVAELVDYDVRQAASSAFDRWLAKYDGEFQPPRGDRDKPRIRLDTFLSELNYSAHPCVDAVIDEMFQAWVADGRNPSTLHDAFLIDGDGDYYNPTVYR